MCTKLIWGIEAAAVVALLVVPLGAAQEHGGSSPMGDRSAHVTQPAQARPAKRLQAPQLRGKDVALDNTRALQPVLTPAGDRARTVEAIPKAMTQPGLNAAAQTARFGEAFGVNLNSPIVDGAEMVAPTAQARPAKRHQAPQLTGKDVALDSARARGPMQKPVADGAGVHSGVRTAVNGAAVRVALQDARFGEVMVGACGRWGCGTNSPIVEGAEVVAPPAQARPAKRHQTPQLLDRDVALDNTRAPVQTPAGDRARTVEDIHKAVTQPGLNAAAQTARFGEAFGSNLNSPVVDGAELAAQPAEVRPARRYQAPQMTNKDVALDNARAHQPGQKSADDRAGTDSGVRTAVSGAGVRVALQDARFGEAKVAGCGRWGCGTNSPIVEGAEMVGPPAQARPAKRHQTPQLLDKDVALDNTRTPVQTPAGDPARTVEDIHKAVTQPGFNAAAQTARFGEAFGSNLNSPVVDGAELAAQPAEVRPARRYQAPQMTGKDVALDNARAHQPGQKSADDRAGTDSGVRTTVNGAAVRVALQDARFGEAMINACGRWGCGTNSPIVDGAEPTTRAFHELNLDGAPNTAGFTFTGARKGHTLYALEVKGATVTARPHVESAPVLHGVSLVGLVFDLRDAGGERYTIRIAGAGTTTYWAGTPGDVLTYTLTYTTTTQPVPQPLCRAGVNEAILFAGDRYDAVRKTVTATGDTTRGWFNIACARTALAKLFLVRHTEASQTLRTTPAERQAMFKMFTADVCGDGTAYTIHGQPLLWADAKGITSFAATPAGLEAVWDENGAVCVDQPRRPELAAAMTTRCGALPRCTAQTIGHVISANPR